MIPNLLPACRRVLLLLMVVALAGSPAGAAPKHEREAHKLYVQARDLFKAGRYQDAIVVLDKAYALFPKSIILVKKAECLEQLDQPEDALDIYDIAAATEKDPGDLGRIETARAALAQVLAQPIELSVVANVAGAEVLVDGAPVGSAPVRVMLRRGQHTIEGRMEGYRSRPMTVVLRGTQPHVATLELEPSSGFIVVATDRGSLASHTITIDDRPIELSDKERLANWTEARPVAAGQHTVACSFPGYRTYVVQVQAVQDDVVEARCNFAEFDVQPAADYTWAWVTLSGALASTGVGVFLVVSYYSDVQEAKDQNLGIETSKDDVGIALLSVGGALAGVSIWLFVDPPMADPSAAWQDPRPSPFQMSLFPMPEGGAVLGASGTF
ncbi:MAG: hypothetical protein AMXMBFR64_31640 [Myxococcales bacterium]